MTEAQGTYEGGGNVPRAFAPAPAHSPCGFFPLFLGGGLPSKLRVRPQGLVPVSGRSFDDVITRIQQERDIRPSGGKEEAEGSKKLFAERPQEIRRRLVEHEPRRNGNGVNNYFSQFTLEGRNQGPDEGGWGCMWIPSTDRRGQCVGERRQRAAFTTESALSLINGGIVFEAVKNSGPPSCNCNCDSIPRRRCCR